MGDTKHDEWADSLYNSEDVSSPFVADLIAGRLNAQADQIERLRAEKGIVEVLLDAARLKNNVRLVSGLEAEIELLRERNAELERFMRMHRAMDDYRNGDFKLAEQLLGELKSAEAAGDSDA